MPVVEPGFSVRGGGSDSYWNIQKTTSVLESWANVLRRTSQARCSAASKAIRNNSELLCVRSRRNMFWWMRLTIKTASLNIPTRCLADTQCWAETMLTMYYGWHVYLAPWLTILSFSNTCLTGWTIFTEEWDFYMYSYFTFRYIWKVIHRSS